LPLLEKAYAKVHGDYNAIQGGDSGEGVEDMTGGVCSAATLNRVLSKDRLWQELLNKNQEFIFALSSPGNLGGDRNARQGLALNHAYSILKAVEAVGEDLKKVRLVLIRNPWGIRGGPEIGEWTGPWSDGSREWTPFWMNKLGHKFGDDGIFWMSFEDMCRKFTTLHRTRLFDSSWAVHQQWTSMNVSYVSGYMTTKFLIEITQPGVVVIVLSQVSLGFR
jgi:Calpain family cysteine protease